MEASTRSLEVLSLDVTSLVVLAKLLRRTAQPWKTVLGYADVSFSVNKNLLPGDLVAGTLGRVKSILQVWHTKAAQM